MNKKMIKKIAPFFSILALCIAYTSNASYRATPKTKNTKITTTTRRTPTKKVTSARPTVRKTTVVPVARSTAKAIPSKNIELLENQLTRTQQQLENARAEIDQLRTSAAVCEATASLPEEIKRLTQENAALVTRMEQQESELQQALDEMISNNEHLSTAQKELAQKDRDIAEGLSTNQNRSKLEDQIMSQAIELAAKEELLAELHSQIRSLTIQMRSLQDENQKQITTLQDEITALEKKNKNLTLAKKTVENQLTMAKGNLEAQAEQHAVSEAAIKETVTKQLEIQFRNQIEQLEQKNIALTAANKELLARPSTGPSPADFDQLKRNIIDQKGQITKLEDEIKAKNKQIEAAQNETRAAERSCEETVRKFKKQLEEELKRTN